MPRRLTLLLRMWREEEAGEVRVHLLSSDGEKRFTGVGLAALMDYLEQMEADELGSNLSDHDLSNGGADLAGL